jgi:hypothetical protein
MTDAIDGLDAGERPGPRVYEVTLLQLLGVAAAAALAVGAVSVGAMAIGALAIGSLTAGRARLRDVEIDRLVVRRLTVLEQN